MRIAVSQKIRDLVADEFLSMGDMETAERIRRGPIPREFELSLLVLTICLRKIEETRAETVRHNTGGEDR